MQPPLHRHVPVTHAVSDLHTEVSVVAVDVLDGSEVVFLFSGGLRAGHEGTNVGKEKNKLAKILTFNNKTLNSYQDTESAITNAPPLMYVLVV